MAEGRRRVRERFGVTLEPEVQTLGPGGLPGGLGGRGVSAVGSAPRRAAGRLAALRPRRPRRRTVVLLALLAALLAGGWLWLRDSSLVAVQRVEVRGLRGAGSQAAATALRDAARSMTTLDVDEARLRRVAAAFPAVREIRITAHLPHRLDIVAVPHVPVAALVAGGKPLAVAGDGTLLPQASAARLPQVGLRSEPAGARLDASAARTVVAALAAAPGALRTRLASGSLTRDHGIVITLRSGPTLYLGPPGGLRAKWAAATRVLADPASAGAAYVDVSAPQRPAVGGLDGRRDARRRRGRLRAAGGGRDRHRGLDAGGDGRGRSLDARGAGGPAGAASTTDPTASGQ